MEQGTCSGWPAGWQSGSQAVAGEPCTRWQQDDGRWRVTSHYISSGSGPLIGARLGISSVVPSGLETFFWATAQMSCHAIHACAFWVLGWAAGAFPNEPLQGARALIH